MTSERHAGFTLYEVVVVLAVIAILGAVSLPMLTSVIDANRRQAVVMDLEAIARALDDYYYDHAAFPSRLDHKDFVGVYLQAGVKKMGLIDEWGVDHQYGYRLSRRPDMATVHSFGEDGLDQGWTREEYVVRVSAAIPGMRKTRIRMRIIAEALAAFLEAGGKVPKHWREARKRLGLGAEYERDGFGNQFHFDGKRLSLVSHGPDGKHGNGDDLSL